MIAGIFIALLSPTDGAVNQIIGMLRRSSRVSFMTDTGAIRWVLVFSEIWRSAGWDSLLYLAAIIAIDQRSTTPPRSTAPTAGRRSAHVTMPGHRADHRDAVHPQHGHVPERRPQPGHQLPERRRTARQIDIIDTYVYRIGLQTGEYSLATAAGLFKAVIGMILIIAAHFVSKRLTGKGVW